MISMYLQSSTYNSYTQLSKLLDCQEPKSSRDNPLVWGSEHYFIISHQVSELLVSQILIDLTNAANIITESKTVDWSKVKPVLLRSASITLMLSRFIKQLLVCCPKADFLDFRKELDGISAASSEQFRDVLKFINYEHPHLRIIKNAIEAEENASFVDCIKFENVQSDRLVCTEISDIIVKGAQIWRRYHWIVAEYFIEDLPGTGGTSGVQYLANRVQGGSSYDGNYCNETRLEYPSDKVQDSLEHKIENILSMLVALEQDMACLYEKESR